jgi:hypothetical protein
VPRAARGFWFPPIKSNVVCMKACPDVLEHHDSFHLMETVGQARDGVSPLRGKQSSMNWAAELTPVMLHGLRVA